MLAARIDCYEPVIRLFKGLKVTKTHSVDRFGRFTPLDEPVEAESFGAGLVVYELKQGRVPSEKIFGMAITDLLKAEGHTRRGKRAQEAYNAREVEIREFIGGICK